MDFHAGPPLLAVAHGSRDPRAAATVAQLMTLARRRRPGFRVHTAYLDHSPPSVGQALSSLAGAGYGQRGGVMVLPLLLTSAYHSKTDIPRALRDARSRHPQLPLHYGDTLGPHPGLINALERRLAEAGIPAGDPDTAIVLAAAGSSDPRANATVAELARAWAGRAGQRPGWGAANSDRSQGWWAVTPAYASAAQPTPATAVAELRAAGAPRVAVASYFLSPGYFADKVADEALAAGADTVADVLGSAPEVADVLLQRYDEAVRSARAGAEARQAG